MGGEGASNGQSPARSMRAASCPARRWATAHRGAALRPWRSSSERLLTEMPTGGRLAIVCASPGVVWIRRIARPPSIRMVKATT
eukprot:10640657-Alexandrium_andersonii.AAC.1